MFEQIPPQRLFFYLIIASFIPFLLIVSYFFSQKNGLDALEQSIETLSHRAFVKEKHQAQNNALKAHHKNSDRFYLNKQLESMTFLKPEIDALKRIANNKNFSGDLSVTKRLEYLTGPDNRLSFAEGAIKTTPQLQEVKESLVRPVEVNADDLREILSKIEGVEIGDTLTAPNRPLILITDFKLDKKSISSKNEVYTLNFKLIKREFQ